MASLGLRDNDIQVQEFCVALELHDFSITWPVASAAFDIRVWEPCLNKPVFNDVLVTTSDVTGRLDFETGTLRR
jgi:hypothetical protein